MLRLKIAQLFPKIPFDITQIKKICYNKFQRERGNINAQQTTFQFW